MPSPPFKPVAYVKDGCPFSFKLWLFLVEAGLADQVQVIRCNPHGVEFQSLKAKLTAGLGKEATFPTLEIEPGRYQSDSDTLIEWFAKRNNIDADHLPALAFYKQTIFPQIVKFHQKKQASD